MIEVPAYISSRHIQKANQYEMLATRPISCAVVILTLFNGKFCSCYTRSFRKLAFSRQGIVLIILFCCCFLLISRPSAVFSEAITKPPPTPKCCGKFELASCSNSCLRASCYNLASGPHACPFFCQAICVCKGDLVYNECTQECVEPCDCPPLCELEKCIDQPERIDHCDHGGHVGDGSASSSSSAHSSASASSKAGTSADSDGSVSAGLQLAKKIINSVLSIVLPYIPQ